MLPRVPCAQRPEALVQLATSLAVGFTPARIDCRRNQRPTNTPQWVVTTEFPTVYQEPCRLGSSGPALTGHYKFPATRTNN